MKICYVAPARSIHTQRWVNYFARNGHECHLISYLFPANDDGFDTRVHIHPLAVLLPRVWKVSRYFSGSLWPLQVRRVLNRIKPDILHSHYVGVYGYLGAISGFHPLILSAWGSDILIAPKRSKIHRFLTKYSLRKADRIICVSPALGEEAMELGASRDKIEIVPTGVDTGEFDRRVRNGPLLRTLEIDESPVIVSTRSLKPVYDVETVIRAIPLVLAEIPRAKFVVAGTGEQADYLSELAHDLGISDNTRFVGWVPPSELPEYLSSADIYVSASLSDGASVSLLEAMACGLAPVVTDIPANRPWINDGETGFLFPAGDYRTLASKIIYLLKNDELREGFGRTSREIVQKKARQRTEMEKIDSIYTELIKGG
jgi:glycosyltransferase involved in cell wall biosynthesis